MKNMKKNILNNPKYKAIWDYNGWKNNPKFTKLKSKYLAQKKWNITLLETVMKEISAPIHKTTIRGGINLIVCSLENYDLFNTFKNFDKSKRVVKLTHHSESFRKLNNFDFKYGTSLYHVGSYCRGNHIMPVYVDEKLPSNIMVACYTEFDLNFHIKKNWKNTIIDEDFFGVIKIKNL
jgi:hypothetical protein